MTVPTDVAARHLIGDRPTWRDLETHGCSTDARIRRAARDGAARASDLPAPVRQVLVEVCLNHTGRATSWTRRFHRLRPAGNATRFVADVLQQASVDPVPYLVDLLTGPDGDDLARICEHHDSPAVRAVARGRLGATREPPPAAASAPDPPEHEVLDLVRVGQASVRSKAARRKV